jgi:hypothetical protein
MVWHMRNLKIYLKGGEMMHFRQLLINSFVIGASLFIPTVALAEKADHPTKPVIQSEKAAKIITSVKKQKPSIENKKTRPSVREPKNSIPNNQKANLHSRRADVEKTTQKIKSLPEQARVTAKDIKQRTVKKSKKVKQDVSVNSPSFQGEKRGIAKKKIAASVERDQVQTQHVSSDTPSNSITLNKPKVTLNKTKEETKHLSSKTDGSADKPIKQSRHIQSNNIKTIKHEKASEPIVKKSTPKPIKQLPGEPKALTPLQANQNSGSASKDRSTHGLTTFSFIYKWFEWEQLLMLGLVHLHIVRSVDLCNQWTNAPPSKPPRSFLSFNL